MSAESQNTLPQTPTYTEYMQSLKPQNKPSTNTPTEDIKFEPEVIKLSECFYKHNTRSINLPWHKNYKILNDLSQNDSGGNSGNLSNGHLSNGHSHSHQLTNQINLRQNLSLLSLSHNSSSSQNPNPMKQNLVSTTDISNSDWSTVKWHNFQNNIVAFKEIPDNLLAYVIVSRSKTNIKVMKADESTCKTVIKGFQRDIIEVKWNDCYYNSKHLNILSALDSSGTLFIYEITEHTDPQTSTTTLTHTELATFFTHRASFETKQIFSKIEVYDEAHSFILLIFNNMIHLIDLFEYIDHQRKAMKNKNKQPAQTAQNTQNETSQAAQTFKFIRQNLNETLDPASINFDYETLNQ
jgi:hypothetical protein